MTKIYTFSRICTIAGICAAMCVFPCCKGSSGGTSGSGADDEEEVSGTEPGEEDEEQQPESEEPTSVKRPKTLLPSKVKTGTVEIDFGNGAMLMMNIVQDTSPNVAWQAHVTGEMNIPNEIVPNEKPFSVVGTLVVHSLGDVLEMLLERDPAYGDVEFDGLRIIFNVPVVDDSGIRQGAIEGPEAIQVRISYPGGSTMSNNLKEIGNFGSGSIHVTFP